MAMNNQKHESVWSKTVDIPPRPALDGNVSVDAAVIGGGLAGILIAKFLQEKGLKTIVLEADRIGSGQTKNSTAKITSQHGLIYHRLIEEFGETKAQQYAAANEQAIEEYRNLIQKYEIDCDFCDAPAWLYSTHSTDLLKLEYEAACKLNIPASLAAETELPFTVASALKFDHQARFNPLKFLKAIAEDITIYEHTRAISVDGNRIQTGTGTVTAKYIVFATHYPFVNFPGFYFMRMHQERSYVVALENAANLMGMYYGIDSDGLSFRPEGNLLFVGGGNHRTGENSTGGMYEKLLESAKTYWPNCNPVASWSAQDCMPIDGIPYIGKFSATEPNWFVATGFQKWGMTSSMVSAIIISDLIIKNKSQNEDVFSPNRFTPGASAKAVLEETMQSMKGLAREFVMPGRCDVEQLPKGHGGVVDSDGVKVGVYKDEQGNIFGVSTKCPHLGCQLEWNPDEKSWDCPCHGSRFDYRGNLIDNPAQENLESDIV